VLRSSFSSPAGELVTERFAGGCAYHAMLDAAKQLLTTLLCYFATLLC